VKCRVCGEELRASNLSGVHTKCMTSKDRAERLFSRYKTDPSSGQGSASDWQDAARAALFGTVKIDEDLALLGFTSMPTLKELKKRYKVLMLEHHPDMGGSAEMAIRIGDAFKRVKERL
jgi:hypothetical protein